MSRVKNLLEIIALSNPDALLADGFEDAILGIAERAGSQPVICYDTEKCLRILMKRDKMTRAEASEFFYFNVVGSYMGVHTPIFITLKAMP